jgi:hypothetical protein
MPKLQLPSVTLVLFDATCPELARLALEDSLDQVDFGDVIICSPERIGGGDLRWIKTELWTDRLGLCSFLWYELPEQIRTDFILIISYDAWVIDASQWTDEFLNYDYVGAPWWYSDRFNVGHGLLRSMRLMRFLAANKQRFPLVHPEDQLLCRQYRPALEAQGFKWASEQLASRFMFECTRPTPTSKHFIFHDVFNFPAVLSGKRLEERLRLLYTNDYIRRSTDKIVQLERRRTAIILPRLAAPAAVEQTSAI